MTLPVITIRYPLDGANGRNWPGVVVLHPQAPEPAAVYAQERYEATWKLHPLRLLRRTFSERTRRELEIMGHEIEVAAAVRFYGREEAERRRQEAASMINGYDGLFRQYRIPSLAAAMAERAPDARAWVRRHERDIARWR